MVQNNLHIRHGLSLELGSEKDYHFGVMVAHKTAQNKSEFLVAGIDQALVNVGVCVNHNGRLATMLFREPKLRGAARLSSLRRNIVTHVTATTPDLVAMEGYAFNSINRAFDLGEIGGILRVEFHDLGIPVIIVPPMSLKEFVTGSGAADKDKMIKYVGGRYRVLTSNDNIADAVGLAKFAEVYLTGQSRWRSELDVMKKFKAHKPKKKKRYKKEPNL